MSEQPHRTVQGRTDPRWTDLGDAERVRRLEPPRGRVRVVLDTDAANEVDDQFALAYAVQRFDRLALEAVYAAPFSHDAVGGQDAVGPAQGMALSQAEAVRVLAALGADDLAARVLPGSTAWLPDPATPVASAAADDLVRRAREGEDPLYVVAIGAPTNVASALLAAPDIAGRLVVVWLGGNGTWWQPGAEYNAYQDLHASRVLLDCGVPLVHVPCYQVTEKLLTTREEVERRVRGRGRVGDLLADLFATSPSVGPRTKELWDVGAVAWVVTPERCPSVLTSSPLLNDDLTWGRDPARHLVREVRDVDADAVLEDLFTRLPEG